MKKDTRFAYRTILTVAVFAVAFVFYLLTASYLPYPGLSSDYLISLIFPWQYTMPQVDILGALVTSHVARLCSPESLMVGMAILSAALGALIVTALFRTVYFTVQVSSLDMEGVLEREMARATRDFGACAEMIGVLTAMVGMVTLPLWVVGTRPLPTSFAIMIASVAIALRVELRYRFARLIQSNATQIGILDAGITILMVALAVMMATYSAPLFPVGLILIILVVLPLFNPAAYFRVRLLTATLVGAALGLLFSIGAVTAWSTYVAGTDISAGSAWAAHVKGVLAQVPSVIMTMPDSMALALCALCTALHLGCFPWAYNKFGKPFLGHVLMVVLPAVAIWGKPTAFWNTLEEPTALSALAIFTLVAFCGTMLGSWARCWLDVHTHWRPRLAHLAAGVMLLIPMAIWAGINVATTWRSGVGSVANVATKACWADYEVALPKERKLWLSGDTHITSNFILRRYMLGNPFAGAPMRLLMSHRFSEFCDSSFAKRLNNDPVLKYMVLLGAPAVRSYIIGCINYGEFLSDAEMDESAGEALTHVAEKVEASHFGKTHVGQRSIARVNAWAAGCYARAAWNTKDAATGVAYLRRAMALDPENKAYPLGLDALAQRAKEPLTPEEKLQVTKLYEDEPWLRQPTWRQMEQFDVRYGQVYTPAFDSARRLWQVRNGAREAALAKMIALFREDCAQLNDEERDNALLILDEAETGERLLQHGKEHIAEVKTYLCLYPLSETSLKLAELYREQIADDHALEFCYSDNNVRHMNPKRMADRASAVFMKESSFRCALLFVKLCLQAGDVERAQKFVSGFIIDKELPTQAYGVEYLRVLVLQAIAKTDAAKARTLAQMWLRSEPKQKSLWQFVLTDATLSEDERVTLAKSCLATDPFHPEAIRIFAEHLATLEGDAAAQRYTDALRATIRAMQ